MCDIQAVSYMIDSCTLTKFDSGLLRLHTADEAAVDWLTSYGYGTLEHTKTMVKKFTYTEPH